MFSASISLARFPTPLLSRARFSFAPDGRGSMLSSRLWVFEYQERKEGATPFGFRKRFFLLLRRRPNAMGADDARARALLLSLSFLKICPPPPTSPRQLTLAAATEDARSSQTNRPPSFSCLLACLLLLRGVCSEGGVLFRESRLDLKDAPAAYAASTLFRFFFFFLLPLLPSSSSSSSSLSLLHSQKHTTKNSLLCPPQHPTPFNKNSSNR